MKKTKQQNISSPKLSAIDLFCGCGGMTEGLKQAGFQVLWGNDVAASPLMAYRANHPEVLVDEKDIRKIECKKLMETLGLKKGDLDLLAGCPPCQGFSSIRTNNGRYSIPDDRNDLINDYLRFVKAFRPKTVMLENVPGLKDDSRFDTFVATMTSLGYQGEWKILNVADYGVAKISVVCLESCRSAEKALPRLQSLQPQEPTGRIAVHHLQHQDRRNKLPQHLPFAENILPLPARRYVADGVIPTFRIMP